MNRLAKSWIIALACVGIAGCSESLSPGDRVVASITPASLASRWGDTVRVRLILHNPTNSAIDLNWRCGSPVDWFVRHTDGKLGVVSAGIDTCDLRDYHGLAAGEIDTIPFLWIVDLPPGSYTLQSAFARPSGLEFLDVLSAIHIN